MRFTRFQWATLQVCGLLMIMGGLAIIPQQFTGRRPEWLLTIAMLVSGHGLLLLTCQSGGVPGLTLRKLILNISLIALTLLLVTQRRQPPLEYQLEQATEVGDLAAVQRLLRRGVDPDAGHDSPGYGWTPLQTACWRGHAAIAQALMHAGADLDYEEKDGFTALIYAAHSEEWSLVHTLLDAGANPLLKGADGVSLRQHAEAAERFDVIQRLTRPTSTEAR